MPHLGQRLQPGSLYSRRTHPRRRSAHPRRNLTSRARRSEQPPPETFSGGQPQRGTGRGAISHSSRAQRRRTGGAGGGAPARGERSAAAQTTKASRPALFRGHSSPIAFVDDTGIEPVTSSVSGKRATAAPIVQTTIPHNTLSRDGVEVETGFEPVYTALQAVASPLGHSTSEKAGPPNPLRADDRVRTGDLNLGKVALYQLSYVRMRPGVVSARREKNISPSRPEFKIWGPSTSTYRHRPVTRRPADPDRLRTKVFRGRSSTCVSGSTAPCRTTRRGLATGSRVHHR